MAVAVARMRHDPSHWKIEGAGGCWREDGTDSQLQAGAGGIKLVAGRLGGGQAKRPSDGHSCRLRVSLGGDGQLGRIAKRGARISVCVRACVCVALARFVGAPSLSLSLTISLSISLSGARGKRAC